jgi:diguanylate cyclase (GGDEF)-like protein
VSYRTSTEPNRRWAQIAIVGSAVSGVLWGAAGFFFYVPATETQRIVLGFILGGMGAGAVTALTPCLPAFYVYLLPSAVPFCIRLALEGDTEHLTMAAACVMYVIALVILGRRSNSWLTESVLRRFDNAELIETLEQRVEERTHQLQEVNEQLHRDIAERRRAQNALADYGSRQTSIADFGQTALSGIDLDRLFRKAVNVVRAQLAASGAAIIEDRLEARKTVLRAASGLQTILPPREPGTSLADHSQSVLEATADDALLNDCGPDLQQLRELGEIAEARILGRDGPFGVLLAVDVTRRQFSENDINFIQSIANTLSAAIERKRAENDIERLALQDPLTGLPNRSVFRNHLYQELARIRRSRQMLAVLLLDLDNFKDVNDTLGHLMGDRLLIAVAERLKMCLRESDAPARLGGDEFAAILSDLPSPEHATSVARKIVDRLAEPFFLDGQQLHIGASVGITISPDDAAEVDALMRNADLALYRAKTEGRNTYKFYAAYMSTQVAARKGLEQDIRRALDQNEFFLEYQPQLHLASGQLTGAEVLLRWRHPTRGLLLPDDFLPVAEATGLIVPLGQWVLDRVEEQICAWKSDELREVFLAINVSLSQCRRGDLVTAIEGIAARTACDLSWLEVEVTEQLFLPGGIDECVPTLRRLRNLGVTISIDDFGTGYSSLGRLRGLPVDKVKVDKSFVAELGESRDAEMVVRAIIALAQSLGITVTAEGVENDRQLTFLTTEGCDGAQGYHISAPLPWHAFTSKLLNASRRFGSTESGRIVGS